VLPLPVSAPFHSALMAPAREGLEPTLRELEFAPLAIPLYRNVDARPVGSPEEVRDGLIRQVDAPVLWSATIRQMLADGLDTFIEVGTGSVLCGLIRRIDRNAICYPAGTVETIEKVVAELVG
jgi:[acyl-carrier-protein] S-malonyltransferase